MKIYGVTVISSEGNCNIKQKDGRSVWCESATKIFPGDEKAAVDYAVKTMASNFDACGFEDDKDFNGQTKENLENALRAGENVTIQLSDEHISIEMFETELKISQIEVETPKGKIVAETKGATDDYPGIWICKDTDQPFNMMAVVEYDSSNKRFQIEGYQSGVDAPRTMTDYETGDDLL